MKEDKEFKIVSWAGIGLLCLMLISSILITLEYRKDNTLLKNENWELELRNQSNKEMLKGCKEYSLFRQAVRKVGDRVYEKDIYDCVHFSKDLVKELEWIGIKSSIAIDKDRTHAWVLVWVEATSGSFIEPEEALELLEIRNENMKIILE